MSTFVLVHGTWHGGWCWEKVVPLLEERGHDVVTVDLPGHGDSSVPVSEITLAAYGDHVAKILDEQAEPVVLVGHSMGGLVVSEAAERRPEQIKLLVYLTGFLLPSGETLLGMAQTDEEAMVLTNVAVNEGNFGRVRRTYIECLQDRAIGPATQKRMYTGLPCERVVSMETSHSPFLSAPEELAEHLDDLARL